MAIYDIIINIRSILYEKGFKQTRKFMAELKGKVSRTVKKLTKEFKDFSNETRRFPARLLSIMFGAMQLSRTFRNMLKPLRDFVGLNEYWNYILLTNTLDAIEPTIDALDLAGEAMRYINNVTGGSLGKMLLFGGAVGDTLSAVSQAELFLNGLIDSVTGAGKAGGLTAGAISELVGIISSIAVPWVFFDETNLKVAKDFLEGVNDEIERFVDAEDRQKAAIASLDLVVPTLVDIYTHQGTLAQETEYATDALDKLKERLDDIETNYGKIDIDLDIIAGGQVINFLTWLAETISPFGVRRGAITGLPYPRWWPVPLQYGGLITRPTLGMLGERGPEVVVPLNRASSLFSPNIYINANISSDIDIEYLANRINESLREEYSRGVGR